MEAVVRVSVEQTQVTGGTCAWCRSDCKSACKCRHGCGCKHGCENGREIASLTILVSIERVLSGGKFLTKNIEVILDDVMPLIASHVLFNDL